MMKLRYLYSGMSSAFFSIGVMAEVKKDDIQVALQ